MKVYQVINHLGDFLSQSLQDIEVDLLDKSNKCVAISALVEVTNSEIRAMTNSHALNNDFDIIAFLHKVRKAIELSANKDNSLKTTLLLAIIDDQLEYFSDLLNND